MDDDVRMRICADLLDALRLVKRAGQEAQREAETHYLQIATDGASSIDICSTIGLPDAEKRADDAACVAGAIRGARAALDLALTKAGRTPPA